MKSEDKHRKIIQAAIKVFARKGFYNARVSEIAREANVADGTIYLYFKNKDDILISLFEEEMIKIIKNMKDDLAKQKDPIDKIRKFAINHLSLMTRNQDLAEVLQVELRQSSKFMRDYVKDHYMEFLNIFASIIKEGQEQGIFREDINTGIAKRAFFGALDEMGRYWVLSTTRKHSITESAKQISEIFIRGMMKNAAKVKGKTA
jgi:TetR/AcrR family fatty acid metabolism transcriptional regulator